MSAWGESRKWLLKHACERLFSGRSNLIHPHDMLAIVDQTLELVRIQSLTVWNAVRVYRTFRIMLSLYIFLRFLSFALIIVARGYFDTCQTWNGFQHFNNTANRFKTPEMLMRVCDSLPASQTLDNTWIMWGYG